MKWLEIIELRSVNANKHILDRELKKLIEELDKSNDECRMSAYSHKSVDTDFCIHLHHDSQYVEANGSPLGLRLAAAFKDYGLINYNVWVEMFND